MSDLWLNIRFGIYHVQIKNGGFKIQLSTNNCHRKKWYKKPIEIYQLDLLGWRNQ